MYAHVKVVGGGWVGKGKGEVIEKPPPYPYRDVFLKYF